MYKRLNLSIFLIAITSNALVEEVNASASIAIDVCHCEWGLVSGNPSSATSLQMGISAKLLLNSMYLGLDYHTSQPEFDNPVQIDSISISRRKINFKEIDLTLGYYLYRHLSIYINYKKIDLDYGNQLTSTVPGFGFLGKYTFTNNWLVFAKATYYLGDLSQGDNKGDTEIAEMVAGTALRLSLYSHLDLSYKMKKIEFMRSNTDDIDFELTGMTLSYNYVF